MYFCSQLCSRENMSTAKEIRYIPSVERENVINALPPAIVHPKVLKLLFSPQYRQRTDEWYAKRKTCLTASDAAAALDENKYQSRSDLIKKKAGLVRGEFQTSAACEHGQKYEDHAADIYMCNNPHLAPFFELGLIMHPIHPFLGASPDRVTKDGILIEIKVTRLSYHRVFFA